MTNEFYLAGEVAKMFHIPLSTVYYYHKKNLLEASRAKNGYRYFDLNQISNMHNVVKLRAMGVSVELLREYVESENLDVVFDMMEETDKSIDEQIRKLQIQKKQLADYRTYLQNVNENGREIVLKNSPDWWMTTVNRELDLMKLVQSYFEVLEKTKDQASHYYFLTDHEKIKKGILKYVGYGILSAQYEGVPGYQPLHIPSRLCAYLLFEGRYSDLEQTYEKLMRWIEEHQLELVSNIVETFVICNKKQYRMELWAPVREKREKESVLL